MFHGKPIIQYSIEAALGLGYDTIVSTDDQEIASFAEGCGADIHFRHWDDPAGDVGTQEIVSRTLERVEVEPTEYVICLYATAPAVTTEVLQSAVSNFNHSTCWWMVGSYPHRLEDCGAFYLGHAEAFTDRDKLIEWTTEAHPVFDHIDINTQDDWDKYEEMYREQAK
jgi:CMP-N-acetylneuraminic acid synthetase